MAQAKKLQIGRFHWDAENRLLELEGRPVALHWRAQAALAALVDARGDVVSREDLFERLWPGITVEDSNLTKVVSELRRALAHADPDGQYIATQPGLGYRLAVPATLPSPPAPTADRRARWAAAGAVAMLTALLLLSFRPASDLRPEDEAEAAFRAGTELLSKQAWAPRQESIPHFQRAIELNPRFAAAHAALAFALTSSPKNPDLAVEAARRAVELDPDCARCLATLGYALQIVEWDWKEARSHLHRAVEIDPSDARSRRWYAHNLAVQGEHGQAIEAAEAASRLAPYEAAPQLARAVALYLAGEYEEAVRACDKAIALEYSTTGAWEFRSKSLFMLGRHKEATGDVFRQWEPWQRHSAETMLRLDRDGWRSALAWFVEASSSSYRIGNNPYHRAWWFALLGENGKALAELEAGLELRPYNMVYTAVDPVFAGLQSEPRFQRILQRLGREDSQLTRAAAVQ